MRSFRQALLEIAAEQGGYFTARQALAAGYSYRSQHYHTAVGDWIRLGRGIFRRADYPAAEREDLIILSLLTHDRRNQPQAVVSHETALAVHQLSDANPERIHLTVPAGFRKAMPPSVILHRGSVPAGDREDRGGYHVTTPLRTLIDIASSLQSWPFLEDAVRDALRAGMVRRKELLDAILSPDAARRLQAALDLAADKAEIP